MREECFVIRRKNREMWHTDPNLWTYVYELAKSFDTKADAQDFMKRNNFEDEGVIEPLDYNKLRF